MPRTVKIQVLALHGGPTLLTRTEGASDPGPRSGRDRDLYDHLVQANMLMVPPPIYQDDKQPELWQRSTRPASLVFGTGGSAPPLNRSEADLIRALVLAPESSGTALAAFRVHRSALCQTLGWKENTLGPALTRLRKREGFQGGLRTGGRGRGEVWLDQTVIRADTLEVAAAMHTARLERDPQRKAYALFSAERAYYYSWRLTPPAVVDAAINATADELTKLMLQQIVDTRWRIRLAYLNLLNEQGHYDRMITLYRLWREYYQNDLKYMQDPNKHNDLPRDVFFGLPCRLPAEDGKDVDAIDLLGELRFRGQGHRTLRKAAEEGIQVDWSATNIEAILRRVTETSAQAVPPTSQPKSDDVVLSWQDVDTLTRAILHSLLEGQSDEHPEADPGHYTVVVALGRSGAILATAIAETLECRYMGWIAISTSRPTGPELSSEAVIRGTEFPLVRARRVIVADGVVRTGAVVLRAVEQVWKHYPDADVTVATYVLTDQGRDHVSSSDLVASQKEQGRHLLWAKGIHLDLGNSTRRNVRFPWKSYAVRRAAL